MIDPVLLKLVASMVTASPFEMARVPELVNVVGSIVSAPPLEAAVIVPLLVKELPVMWRVPPASRLVDIPLIDDAVACVVTRFDLPRRRSR